MGRIDEEFATPPLPVSSAATKPGTLGRDFGARAAARRQWRRGGAELASVAHGAPAAAVSRLVDYIPLARGLCRLASPPGPWRCCRGMTRRGEKPNGGMVRDGVTRPQSFRFIQPRQNR